MIYLIGGTPRVGKSTLASLILERNKISSLSTDVLRNVLDYSPLKVGIKDIEWSKRPEAFLPYFSTLLHILQNKYPNYVIEGDLFTPAQIHALREKIDLKCIFLGTSNITLEDLKRIDPHLDWVSKISEEEQSKLSERFITWSKMFETEAEKYGFKYFDIYPNREEALEAAHTALIQ